jgi:hypothetical protein
MMYLCYELGGSNLGIRLLGFWLAQPPGLGTFIRCLAFLELLKVIRQVNR